MDATFEKGKNIKAIITTVVIHALLLLLAAYYVIGLPEDRSELDMMGMEVNLGTTEDGFGIDQPEDMNDPAPLELANQQQVAQASSMDDAIADVHTDDNISNTATIQQAKEKPKEKSKQPVEKTPITEKKKEVSNTTNIAKTNTPSQSTPPQGKYKFSGGSGAGGNQASNNKEGGSEGVGQGEGDMGVPTGSSGATNYAGKPGKGNTLLDFELSNRFIANKPSPGASFSKAGTVKVSVKVNRAGKITSWSFVSGGNDELRAIVSQKIKEVSFNNAANAPVEQIGTISFNFKAGK